jgi:hypothetical protein
MKIATVVFAMTAMAQPLACNLNALTPPERKEHTALSRRLIAAFGAPASTPDGWSFSLPIEMLNEVAKWIDGERRCCPFLRFSLDVEPGAKTVGLTLSGREGVKEFLAAELKLRTF